MKRLASHWRAIALSLTTYWVATAVLLYLSLGWGPTYLRGPLEGVLDAIWVSLRGIIGDDPSRYVIAFLVLMPPFLLGLLVYERVRARGTHTDGFLHCVKCDYILKGLSEPRCPECGERI